jgi:biotin carboxyl carrier protein
MTFDIEIGGRFRSVAVERAGREGRYRVTIDGRLYEFEVRRVGAHSLLLSSGSPRPKMPGLSADKSQSDEGLARSYELGVAPAGTTGEFLVTVGGRTAIATINGRRTGRATEKAQHATGDQRIVAPMPGRIVRVLVAVGDEVAPRQGVVVVEAMKMENELRAPKGGRVKDVSVTPGTSVEAGRVLVVIE